VLRKELQGIQTLDPQTLQHQGGVDAGGGVGDQFVTGLVEVGG